MEKPKKHKRDNPPQLSSGNQKDKQHDNHRLKLPYFTKKGEKLVKPPRYIVLQPHGHIKVKLGKHILMDKKGKENKEEKKSQPGNN